MMEMRSNIMNRREGTILEKDLRELEIDVRIANARAELALGLLRALIRELSGGIVSWDERDLFRSYRETVSLDDPAERFAHLDIVGHDADELGAGGAYLADIEARRRLRDEIWDQIRHERDPS